MPDKSCRRADRPREAVAEAERVENLLAEASRDRLIHPSQVSQPVTEPMEQRPQDNMANGIFCYNCGGRGHTIPECPSRRRQRQQTETTPLQPGTETYVPCYTSSSPTVPVMLVTQSEDLLQRSLLISPTVFTADNASYFKGELISEIGRLLRIGRYFTTPYHHEGNGAYKLGEKPLAFICLR
ncbi:unnamed protein product [Cylicocyclus nassatus]|uniref:CCHC-type domain-containing protein n=1 Tax=Cylicocyclus nassatus TaxID=53992 RepID=A0AA36GS11_CYLNA|nr:unnamed protein product [Cylicocyclus nassatus]